MKTQQGHKHWTNAEATKVVGATRESTQEDLFNAIEKGDFPKWKMQVQVIVILDEVGGDDNAPTKSKKGNN